MTDYLSQGITYQTSYPYFPYYVAIVAPACLWYIKYELTGTVDKSNDTNHKIGKTQDKTKSRYCGDSKRRFRRFKSIFKSK